jgi:RNase P/RNase MRP subunit p29
LTYTFKPLLSTHVVVVAAKNKSYINLKGIVVDECENKKSLTLLDEHNNLKIVQNCVLLTEDSSLIYTPMRFLRGIKKLKNVFTVYQV